MQRACRRACLALAFFVSIGTTVHGASFLGDALVRKDQVQDVLEHKPVRGEPLCQRQTTGPIETTMCDYETIESVNEELYANLHDLVQTPFFRYFQVDLYRECPFWQENGFCMNRECGITTVDESEIPEKWRAATLSKIDLPPEDQRIQLPGCYYRDSDFCFLDDMTEGDYVDLTHVPERYTGYSGNSANRVWRAIYEENCFGLSELNLLTGKSAVSVTLPDTLTDIMRLHASISTHICTEWLNQSTGEWAPNLECFVTKVASHPERLQYIYFNTVLLLRAVARLAPYLSEYDYCSTSGHSFIPHHHPHSPDLEDEVRTLARLDNVMDIASHVGKFDERVLFRGANANVLKQEFKQHFRNVSRIMDCIGCDKCRLWGKVQTTGLATALKVLFEIDENALRHNTNQNLLQRSEVVALINTLHRFSESLHAVEHFREMWKKTGEEDSARLIHEAERAVTGNPRPTPDAQTAQGRFPATATRRPIPKALQQNVRSKLWLHLSDLVDNCRRHTLTYLDLLSEIWQRLSKAVFPLRTEL
ncbi:hypothetical protein J3R83DRAFT_4265 [Lanmaoa asiatica]|nr:hypothetical protein J3R83DRAFT_4265 [Lanmaoa asiatica]